MTNTRPTPTLPFTENVLDSRQTSISYRLKPHRLIPAIRANSGKIHTDPTTINKMFAEFYADLYSSDCLLIVDGMVNDMTFPQVDAGSANESGGLITTAEVQEAINSLQSGKSPGRMASLWSIIKPFPLSSHQF